MNWALFLLLLGAEPERLQTVDSKPVCDNLANELKNASDFESVQSDFVWDYVCIPLPTNKMVRDAKKSWKTKILGDLGQIGSYPYFNVFDRFDNQIKIVNFFSSENPSSKVDADSLQLLKDKGFKTIYGLAVKDSFEGALQFLENQNPFSAVAFDETGKTAKLWGVDTSATTLIVSRKGDILHTFHVPLTKDVFKKEFMPKLQEALLSPKD